MENGGKIKKLDSYGGSLDSSDQARDTAIRLIKNGVSLIDVAKITGLCTTTCRIYEKQLKESGNGD